MPNHYHSLTMLFDQYGHFLSDSTTAVNVLFSVFFIGILIGFYFGLKDASPKDDKKK